MCRLILCDASVPDPEASARALCVHAMAANLKCEAQEATAASARRLSFRGGAEKGDGAMAAEGPVFGARVLFPRCQVVNSLPK